jgi:Ca2+-binding EF-hand superfamily protein
MDAICFLTLLPSPLLLLPQLLGLHVKRAEIGELLAEVDSDGSGEVEYPEFIEIMTSTLAKLAEKKEQEGSAGNQVRRQFTLY